MDEIFAFTHRYRHLNPFDPSKFEPSPLLELGLIGVLKIFSFSSFVENELLPGVSALGSDVAALAGELEFRVDEINYICSKKSPFKFLLDQWCKRDRKKATLNQLAESLREIRRPDLAEKVHTFMSSEFLVT